MREVIEWRGEMAGQPAFWREAPGDGVPVLYLHGVPTSSDDWVDFLAVTGGLAPDLPGFGRTSKRADNDFTMYGLAAWLERFLAEREVERVRLVVHDWGAVGLLWAMREPERVERLVVMNAVPFLPGYRWHRWARMWRTRGLGELAVGSMVRPVVKLVTREATPRRGFMPDRFLDEVDAHFDQGTQRAIVRLYRGAPEEELARAGEHLGRIACPALVLWGRADPYIPERFAHGYAAALGDATLEMVDDAGHWPWLDRPEVVQRVAGFLDEG